MRANLRDAWRHTLAAAALLLALAGVASAATITIINGDGAGEGFNDPTPAAPVGGNPGTTVGAQRLYVFNYAAAIWGSILPSTVEIKINARFDGQTCDAGGAVLGSAGAGSSHRNFANAPYPNTWYQQSLANRIAGFDLNPTVADVNITFNSNLCNPGCVFCWYYGVDGNEGALVELLPVVFHELGHGLGFATITLAGVQQPSGGGGLPGPHIYDRFLYDLDQGMHWHEMASDAQRGASAVNCQRLAWDGGCVKHYVPSRLGPRPLLRVNSPAAIAGDYSVGMAHFGPQSFTVTGELVLGNDGTSPPNSPFNACEPLVNGVDVAGKIAVVDRGTCSRAIKVKNCQDAGAIAVVVVDTLPGCPAVGMSGYDPSIFIPSVQVMADDGNAIKSQIASGVNATLTFDASQLAGAVGDRALVYTPTVFATGSSVSHWDTSHQPNSLMEPFITNSVSRNPDLAVPQLHDIGWFGTVPCEEALSVPETAASSGVQLAAPYPNPAARFVSLKFRLSRPEYVRLAIVDVSGRLVRTLHDGMLPPGEHLNVWDGAGPSRQEVPPGVYMVTLRTSSGVETQTLSISR